MAAAAYAGEDVATLELLLALWCGDEDTASYHHPHLAVAILDAANPTGIADAKKLLHPDNDLDVEDARILAAGWRLHMLHLREVRDAAEDAEPAA